MKRIQKNQDKEKKIVLASQSPRRRELIQLIHPDVQFLTAKVDETVPDYLKPEQVVQVLAEKKARTVEELLLPADQDDSYVIGCDTIVSLDGKIYGKPKDKEDAKRMLRELSGKTHQVYTGVSVLYDHGKEVNFAEKTDVTFKDLDDDMIERYIETGEPMDKAGAYGIQGEGGKLVESFEGDYDNVIGLPVEKLERILRLLED